MVAGYSHMHVSQAPGVSSRCRTCSFGSDTVTGVHQQQVSLDWAQQANLDAGADRLLTADAVSWVQESGLGLADVAAALKEQQAGLLTAQDCIIDCSHPPVAWSSPAIDIAPQAEVVPFPVPAHKQNKQGLVKQLPSIIQVANAALTGGGRVILCDRSGEVPIQLTCLEAQHNLNSLSESPCQQSEYAECQGSLPCFTKL